MHSLKKKQNQGKKSSIICKEKCQKNTTNSHLLEAFLEALKIFKPLFSSAKIIFTEISYFQDSYSKKS